MYNDPKNPTEAFLSEEDSKKLKELKEALHQDIEYYDRLLKEERGWGLE